MADVHLLGDVGAGEVDDALLVVGGGWRGTGNAGGEDGIDVRLEVGAPDAAQQESGSVDFQRFQRRIVKWDGGQDGFRDILDPHQRQN